MTLDPATTNQIVAMKVAHQILETLVKLEPGGTEVVPSLARSWSTSDGGRVWRFRLEEGVRFHDDTPFNAAAVCTNFERWYRFTGILQSPSVSGVYRTVFGGFALSAPPGPPAESLYRSCDAPSDLEAVVTLVRPPGAFLSALASPSLSMASPDALGRYEADKVSGTTEAPRFEGTCGTQHPTGIGAFRFEQWTTKDRLVLVRKERYWAERPSWAGSSSGTFPDGSARRQALETGEIDGYDPVDPPDVE